MTNSIPFDLIPALVKEMETEAATTRKMLALIPDDKHDWAPHPKSMKMGPLTIHIATIPSWVEMALNNDTLDFAVTPYKALEVGDNAALLQLFEKSYSAGRKALMRAQDTDLSGTWTIRKGEQVFAKFSKYEAIRRSFSQTCHHRAQLGVYLRLLDVPIPGSYGSSADEHI